MPHKLISYLVIASAIALSASAQTIVDFTFPGGEGNSGLGGPDSTTSTTATWTFSDTAPLASVSGIGYSNTTLYGGIHTTFDNSTNPSWQQRDGGTFRLSMGSSSVNSTADGIFLWKKEDFLTNSSEQLGFTAADSLSVTVNRFASGVMRIVVQQGGVYYASSSLKDNVATSEETLSITDIAAETWAPINNSDYTLGTFAPMNFTDIEAVGIWFDMARDRRLTIAISDFQATATPAIPYQAIDLANILMSGCVLQRDQPVKIWGTATPGLTITVDVNSQSVQTTVDANGDWVAVLDPEPAGGPFTMTISDAVGDPVVLTDVYFGDVWILTGQSNMFNQLQGLQEGREPYPYYPQPIYRNDPTNDFDDVRFFIVSNQQSPDPVDDINVNVAWSRWESNKLGKMSIVGYYFTRALNDYLDANGMSDVPIGIIKACKGATGAEEWTSPDGLATMPEPIILASANSTTSELYNGVIQPIQNYAIKGALWYQGENNSGSYERCEQYDLVMQALIESWRDEWGIDFPFYYVQLAPYKDFTPIPSDERWPWLRESQTNALDLVPNTKMACIIDIGFQQNIHPAYKDIVGQRLANIALADTYGFDLVHRGPTATEVVFDGSTVTITFDNVGDGLQTQAVDAQDNAEEIANGDLPVSVSEYVLAGFALCGSDQKFYWATDAEIISPNQVRISNLDDVPNPVNVRYAWQFFPMCNLFNSAGLPAEPFRTDDYAPQTSTGGELTSPTITAAYGSEDVLVEWQPLPSDWVLEYSTDVVEPINWLQRLDTYSVTSEYFLLEEAETFRLTKQTP